MKKTSAGILVYRYYSQQLQVLLVHPGGPFWKNKDAGSWSIPKGEYAEGEAPLAVALREFYEETGNEIQGSEFIELTAVKQKSGKWVKAWAVAVSFDPCFIQSNTFEMEWPPKSGKLQSFPEVDRAEYFSIEEAVIKMSEVQFSFVKELQKILHEAV